MFGSKKAKVPPAQAMGGLQSAETERPVEQSQDLNRDALGNGGKATGAPEGATSEEVQRRAAIAIRQSLAFAQIVSVLMRSPHYKHYSLADLEWLVLPPLLTGQFSIAEAGDQKSDLKVPVAVALWANVSAEVDKRLSANLSDPIRLRPDEWRSGEIAWLVDAVGDARVVSPFLKQLSETVFKAREVKVRSKGPDGRPQLTFVSKLGIGDSRASP